MSCPLMKQSSTNPPMVTCHNEGMVVKTDWTSSTSKMKVNLNDGWEPLMKASLRCGFGLVVHPEGVVISVQYTPCLEKKDGFYTLGLSGDGETQISCPSLFVAQPESPINPATVPILQTTLTPNPAKFTSPQVPSFNWNPKIPNWNPNQGPKDINQPLLPYYPSFFYQYPAIPDVVSTVQSPKSLPPVKKTTKNQRLHFFVPLYPQAPTSQPTPTQPSTTKPPLGNLDDHFLPNPFNLPAWQPQKPVGQSGSQPKSPEQRPLYPLIFHSQPSQPQPSGAPPVEPPSYTLYPETLPKKPRPRQPTVPVKPQAQTGAPQPEAPPGPVYQPFYHYAYHSQSQPAMNPTAAPQSPGPETPQGSVYQPFFYYPSYPHPKPGNPPASKEPPGPQSPKIEAPQGQVHQPMYFHPQPKPDYQPVKNPTVAPQPGTETPPGQGQKPCPAAQIPGINNKAPVEKPGENRKPQKGEMHQPFNLFYYPQQPQPFLMPPYGSVQHQVAHPASDLRFSGAAIPSNVGDIQQGAQLSPLYMQPYCSLFCPPGISNCCPQIVFHQHLHVVPTGQSSKDAPSWYPGLSYLPSVAFSEFGNGLSSVPSPEKPAEATTTQAATGSTSPSISPQSLPPRIIEQPYLQPPDGNPAALPGRKPSIEANPILPVHPHFASNPLYPHRPNMLEIERLQNLLQSVPSAHSNDNSKAPTSGQEPVNPVVHYEPFIQSPTKQISQLMSAGNMNNPQWPFIGKYLPLHYRPKPPNLPKATDWLTYHKKSSNAKGSARVNIHRERDRYLVPYSMVQDASVPIHNKSVVPNSEPETLVNDLDNSTKQGQTLNPDSEQKSYLLLQHGPPGKELNSFSDSVMPFRDLLYGTYSVAQEPASDHSSKPQNAQNFGLPQENTQHLKWPEEGTFDALLGHDNYEQRSGDQSGWPTLSPASNGLQFGFMPHEPSFSAAHLNPKIPESFEDPWKPLTPRDSIQRFPPQVPGNMFQHWSFVADQQGNGMLLKF
ncbi:adhesive plaque matrix protein-like isoform X2 [Acanthochromis polyacanthus]|uniref:adhesive plaque matrix protein-like isoform X2 n=1 Tax=Acanthochromis polyacanthus TaxID=80966 RepID=UPI002234A87B|nr:adhesive plaque matrix protein-like isoform X2 [Acanthochromis polyacanthus]